MFKYLYDLVLQAGRASGRLILCALQPLHEPGALSHDPSVWLGSPVREAVGNETENVAAASAVLLIISGAKETRFFFFP